MSVIVMAQEAADDLQSILDQSCLLNGVLLSDVIGSGSYAKVYKGEWKGIPVAVKQLHGIFSEAGPLQREGLTRTFYKELGMNIKLRHPNIIQFLGVVFPQDTLHGGVENGTGRASRKSDDFPMMVMELMHCTLDTRLSDYREASTRMPFSETVDTAIDIAAALVYLHGKDPPIAHRDLAPKNVLLSSSGTAKLCDLGVAKWAKSSLKNTPGPGTLPYMPPEVRVSTSYSPVVVDIYSLGVTLLEMCSGLEPKPKDFAHMSPTDGSYRLVPEKNRRDKSFAALQENHPLMTIIEQCLQHIASKRPTATQLLRTLQDMKKDENYLESKQAAENKSCPHCDRKDEELSLLRQRLQEQEEELSRLYEANKTLENFRDDQLRNLQSKLRMAAIEGEKYQSQLQEMQDELDEQVQTNRQLEMSYDRTNDINHILRQKVDLDSHLNRVCHTHHHHGHEKSMSVRVKPTPKPRKSILSTEKKARASAIPQSLLQSSTMSASISHLPGLNVEDADDTYLQLDAIGMVKAEAKKTTEKRNTLHVNIKKPGPLLKRQSSPGLFCHSETKEPLLTLSNANSIENDYSNGAEPRRANTSNGSHTVQDKKEPPPSLSLSQPETNSDETSDEGIYVRIPASGPPTPPPRDQDFKFTRGTPQTSSLHSRPNCLSVIAEKDESIKSPLGAGPPSLTRNQRTAQSMKSPRAEAPQTLAPPRPTLSRQGSRGDVLISEVVNNVKGKNSSELTAKKGELVRVTNSGLEKKLCIAVKTNGASGTIRKKNLERIDPVTILYDFTNPALSNRKGVINHIAQCSSYNNTWISPVESNRIQIIPSSIHSGDAGLLVKMTDYLLCCTDGEEKSHFEIDLREQRLLKVSGYVLQCHAEGNNGAPLHWELDGSHNGHSWSCLSEESGDFFRKKPANFFSVINPMPCRYFRLTQLGKNTAGNFRFCLSGIEFYGQLYSSVVEERYTQRIH